MKNTCRNKTQASNSQGFLLNYVNGFHSPPSDSVIRDYYKIKSFSFLSQRAKTANPPFCLIFVSEQSAVGAPAAALGLFLGLFLHIRWQLLLGVTHRECSVLLKDTLTSSLAADGYTGTEPYVN